MKVGVVRESYPGERRVALVPTHLGTLTKASLEVLLETGAGERAGSAGMTLTGWPGGGAGRGRGT